MIIAFGRIDDDILKAFHWAAAHMKERKKALKGDGWVEDEVLRGQLAQRREEASATSRGRRVVGIQHAAPASKRAREKAKKLDKRIEVEQRLFEQRKSTMSKREWESLQDEAAEAWRWHDKLREREGGGSAYKGRDGKWVGLEAPNLVGLTIKRWSELREEARRSVASA